MKVQDSYLKNNWLAYFTARILCFIKSNSFSQPNELKIQIQIPFIAHYEK